MFDIVKFYFKVIAELVSSLWDKLEISNGVSYTSFFFGGLLMCTFIKLLKLSLENNGAYIISKAVKNSKQKKNN